MVGVAVKVTLVPAQIELPGFAAIVTDGTTFVFTVTVKEQLIEGASVILYVTVVVPELNICPLAVPFPLPVVAPLNR